MEKQIIIQKLKKDIKDSFFMAEMYYTVLSGVNSLHLTPREIQLVAFTAVKGNISYSNIRKEFCNKYNTTSPTINNIISKLKRVGIFVKDGSKIKVNPIIVLDFTRDIQLQLNLVHG